MGYKITAVRRENPQGALVAVPDEVAKELEETFTYLSANPKECGLVSFDTADEVKTFLSQARSWARTRDAGAVDFRKLPSPGLGDKAFRFTITAPKAAETPAAEGAAPAAEEAAPAAEAPKAAAKAK